MEVASPVSFPFSETDLSFFFSWEGEWPSHHALNKNKKSGGSHLPIPLRKTSETGGDQPSVPLFISICFCFSKATCISSLLNWKGIGHLLAFVVPMYTQLFYVCFICFVCWLKRSMKELTSPPPKEEWWEWMYSYPHPLKTRKNGCGHLPKLLFLKGGGEGAASMSRMFL